MILETKNLTFGYKKNNYIINGINLSIRRGERLRITGPSGCGKSTLCQLLAGFIKPLRGSILLDKHPLPDKGFSPVQMIYQHPEIAVDPLMTMGNSLKEAEANNDRLLKKLGIRKEWLSRYPGELSGGEIQRFCIARALAGDIDFLICDEISAMLDPITQSQIWNVISEECISRNIGLIYITHQESLATVIGGDTIEL